MPGHTIITWCKETEKHILLSAQNGQNYFHDTEWKLDFVNGVYLLIVWIVESIRLIWSARQEAGWLDWGCLIIVGNVFFSLRFIFFICRRMNNRNLYLMLIFSSFSLSFVHSYLPACIRKIVVICRSHETDSPTRACPMPHTILLR